MFRVNILPGQGYKQFEIYKETTGIKSNGSVGVNSYKKTNRFIWGCLTEATPTEKEEWAQKGHAVTHKITQHNAMIKAAPTDVLVLNDGRCFYVRGINNPGDLSVVMIYDVEERNEVHELIERMGREETDFA